MSQTRGNRWAYLNTAEYVLAKTIELLEQDGLKGTDSWVHATEAYERVFRARDMDKPAFPLPSQSVGAKPRARTRATRADPRPAD